MSNGGSQKQHHGSHQIAPRPGAYRGGAQLSPDHKRSLSESVDDRMISLMRLILATSAMMIIYIDPSEPDKFVPITYGALVLYTVYSAVIYVLAVRRSPLMQTIQNWSHWADIAWYMVLIALSSGTSSIFYFFFFFSILVASFRWGFVSGLRVVIVSSVMFTFIGYATAPAGPDFELNRFLLRPIYLLILGYMIAYWGGLEVTLVRRLTLLREVTMFSNPRFGVDHTIGSIMERLRDFYDADTCLLIMRAKTPPTYYMRRADRSNPERAMRAEPIAEEMVRGLLAIAAHHAVIYNGAAPRRWGLMEQAGHYSFDVTKDERNQDEQQEASEMIANMFGANSFISMPILRHDEAAGRLFLTSTQHTFSLSDIGFVRQVVEQVMPVIENIQLLDRLASEAAEQERQRISRDIHDSVIQPYVGLKLGLEVLRQKVAADDSLAREIDGLIEVAGDEIGDLRRYIGGLKGEGASEHGDVLLEAVRRQTAKFSELYGINVEVQAETEIHVNDRLAAEAFQIVREGLSNVRRHTKSKHATINLACSREHLVLQIENDGSDKYASSLFVPRSITERAAALGGKAHVEQQDDGHTLVRIEIPL